MPRRKRARVEAQGEQPPHELPTVWDAWVPLTEGPTVQGLRALFVVMDAHVVHVQENREPMPEQLELLARVMWAVYESAVGERIAESVTGANQ